MLLIDSDGLIPLQTAKQVNTSVQIELYKQIQMKTDKQSGSGLTEVSAKVVLSEQPRGSMKKTNENGKVGEE
jgi:hypothetical protein